MERFFPERRLFLRSDSDTRFIRLRPGTQALAFAGGGLLVSWTIIATAILLMDSISAGNFREQARRDQVTYQQRLNEISRERDRRAAEALAAQERFNTALTQVSEMQSQLLDSETRRRELETGIDVIQTTLRTAMKQREDAAGRVAALEAETQDGTATAAEADGTMDLLSEALARTAQERDQVVADAQDALVRADQMATDLKLMEEKNDLIFRQLEEAMTVSVKPLDKMFTSAGIGATTSAEPAPCAAARSSGSTRATATACPAKTVTRSTSRCCGAAGWPS